MGEPGRPPHDDDWYKSLLEEMRPILCLGNSIRYAATKTGNESHVWVLYDKYKQGDWFAHKVDAYRAMPGELVNNIVMRLATTISDKVTNEKPIDRNDIEIIKLIAEKSRSAQPFFVSRTETAEVNPDDVGKILDKIENEYASLGSKIKGQSVPPNAPVQDTKQAGRDSAVPAELPTDKAS